MQQLSNDSLKELLLNFLTDEEKKAVAKTTATNPYMPPTYDVASLSNILSNNGYSVSFGQIQVALNELIEEEKVVIWGVMPNPYYKSGSAYR